MLIEDISEMLISLYCSLNISKTRYEHNLVDGATVVYKKKCLGKYNIRRDHVLFFINKSQNMDGFVSVISPPIFKSPHGDGDDGMPDQHRTRPNHLW